MNDHPPKWAGHFLKWYCNPDLLEEIQGDAYELYAERRKTESKRSADLKYVWDIIRFLRWSNIRRTQQSPWLQHVLWNFNLKIAMRNARSNKLVFSVKTIGLAISLAFVLLLTAFAVNELSYDQFHKNHERIFRVTSKVTFQDQVTHYAVTPLPIGQALKNSIPEVENYSRFMYQEKPVFRIDDKMFFNEVALAVDSNFLQVFTYDILEGTSKGLRGPNKIALTKNTAVKFFGEENPLGRMVNYGDALLEVAAVLDNVPINSHLKFDALISWDTFERWDDWGNLNAYTYILLKPDANLEEVRKKLNDVLATFHELVEREYQATFEPIFHNITEIHYAGVLDEDIAVTGNRSNLFILFAVIVLTFVTGLINYLNLSMAELTNNLKRIGILKVFGGSEGKSTRYVFSDAFITLGVAIPLALVLAILGWRLSEQYLSIHFDKRVLSHSVFILTTGSFVILLVISTKLNAFLLAKVGYVVSMLKGKVNQRQSAIPLRKILVGAQLAFSIVMIALIFVVVDQFRFIREADKGFNDKNTIVVNLRNHNRVGQTFNHEVRNLSGVVKVDDSSYFPGVIETKYVFRVEKQQGMEQLLVPMMTCGPEYFETLDIKLADGRLFDKSRTDDYYGAFIINETAAREFGWKEPVGKRIDGPVTGQDEAYYEGEVIGVVRDFNFATLHSKIEPMIIFLSDDNWLNQYVYIKTNPIHSPNLINEIETIYKSQWPDTPFEYEYLDSKYLSLYKKDQEMKNIFETGLVISIIISCLGIFSISALLAALRTKEMGIRKVVGASVIQLFILHARSFTQFLIIAAVVAFPIIYFLSTKWLENFAYHVDLTSGYFLFPVAIALLLTLIISGYHGIKGAMVNPVDTLKYE